MIALQSRASRERLRESPVAIRRKRVRYHRAIGHSKEALAALRALRDCGIIMARGEAQSRFRHLIKLGFAVGRGDARLATFRLSPRGKTMMDVS